MIIKYTDNEHIRKREEKAEEIFSSLPYRYCLITGSFIYKKNYKDIDVFVISRSKKKAKAEGSVRVQSLDFNDLHSLFYHSIIKQCIAKNILPKKPLKVTMAQCWESISEAYISLMNDPKDFRKHARDIMLYIHYAKTREVLGSIDLAKKTNEFRGAKEVQEYVKKSAPKALSLLGSKTYRKRYFYTQAASYKELFDYGSYTFLYAVAHEAAQA